MFPLQFKQAIITVLFKKPSLCKEQLSNYRQVSNLCYKSKLLERVVAMKLNKHLIKNGLVNHLQSAYKTEQSTESVLLTVVNYINNSFAKGKCLALEWVSAMIGAPTKWSSLVRFYPIDILGSLVSPYMWISKESWRSVRFKLYFSQSYLVTQ